MRAIYLNRDIKHGNNSLASPTTINHNKKMSYKDFKKYIHNLQILEELGADIWSMSDESIENYEAPEGY